MKRNGAGYLYLLITVVLFSTYEVVSKTLVGKIDPFQINFIRFLVGGIILFLFALIKGDIRISWVDFCQVWLLGVINVVISMNLLQLSLYIDGAKASIVAVIFSGNPIFVTVFSAFFEKEKISMHKLIGLLMGVAGIIVVFLQKLDIRATDYKSPLLVLSSAAFFGLYSALGRKVSVKIGSLKMNAYSFLSGSLTLIPVLIIFRKPIVQFDYSGMLQVAYLSVMVTGIAYWTYFKGLPIMGASSGSLVFFVKPVLASVIAILFLKESASINLFLGTFIIIAGILSSLYWPSLSGYIKRHRQSTRTIS